MAKLIAVDFDGTVHAYSQGWHDGSIYDGPVPGFFDWLQCTRAAGFDVMIASSRCRDYAQVEAMLAWLEHHGRLWAEASGQEMPVIPPVTDRKPAAWLTIDDRVIRFDGDWGDDDLQPEALHAFRPWNAMEPQRGNLSWNREAEGAGATPQPAPAPAPGEQREPPGAPAD